jgi:hypothetical protein
MTGTAPRAESRDAAQASSRGLRDLLSMIWSDVLFAHWDVDPERVARRLPPDYEVDTYDGRAYLGVVAFEMSDIGPSFLPSPFGRSFGELNLRTYVRGPDGTPGVFFFNLDADDRLSVTLARSLFRLPYYRADIDVSRRGAGVEFRSRRTHREAPAARFHATYGPDGETFTADAGSLEAFLVERYRFYTVDDAGRTYYGDIDHPPWSLAPARAEIPENGLFEANGFSRPEGEPLLHYAAEIRVTADRVRRTR